MDFGHCARTMGEVCARMQMRGHVSELVCVSGWVCIHVCFR